MLVHKKNFLMISLSIFFITWIFKVVTLFPFNYFMLLGFLLFVMIYFFKYKQEFKIPTIYNRYFDIRVIGLFLFLLSANMFNTILTGRDSNMIIIKIFMIINLPIFFFIAYADIYKYNLSKFIKYIFIYSLIFQIIFSFAIGHYDAKIGKIFLRNNFFSFSSNELSLYMVFTVTIFGWIYYYFYKNSNIKLYFVSVLPFFHLSKSHLAIYIVSILLSYIIIKKKYFLLIIIVLITISISKIIYLNESKLKQDVNSLQIQRILLANKIINEHGITNLHKFITKVGDGTRANLVDTFSKNMKKSKYIGFGDRANIILVDGHDYHNMMFFYFIQYSLFGFLSFLFVIAYFLYVGIKKLKYLNFIVVFLCFYLLLRGLFITFDPYRILILFLFLMIVEANLRRRKPNENNNIT